MNTSSSRAETHRRIAYSPRATQEYIAEPKLDALLQLWETEGFVKDALKNPRPAFNPSTLTSALFHALMEALIADAQVCSSTSSSAVNVKDKCAAIVRLVEAYLGSNADATLKRIKAQSVAQVVGAIEETGSEGGR
jgi:hypothetical protein